MHDNMRTLLAIGLLTGTMAATHAATVNFNMSALTPAPAFDSVILNLNLGAFLGSGSIGCQIFGDLNLTGGSPGGCAVTTDVTFTDSRVVDGIFSISWSQSGFVQKGLPYVIGVKNGIRTTRLFSDGTVEATVPEPTTLALLGLGLAGIVWSRRKMPG